MDFDTQDARPDPSARNRSIREPQVPAEVQREKETMRSDRPDILFVFADQWRAQAAGYMGNPDVQTPHLDALAARSVNFRMALSGCPVCSPARASYLTGRHPLSHGVFVNDVPLADDPDSLARCFARYGYRTGYIGKWHVDGAGRSAYIPSWRRQGFERFFALECTHDYLHSRYYADDDPVVRVWPGYDAKAQTEEACRWIREASREDPFLLVLSWGPPHGPWPAQSPPRQYMGRYDPSGFTLRGNVPDEIQDQAKGALHQYYAHCTALDECIRSLRDALEQTGRARNTILLFTSDHGDMLLSHGQRDKQRPWDESIRVPFLVHWPAGLGTDPIKSDAPIDCPDVLPTLLGLCGLEIPEALEGLDFADHMRGGSDPSGGAAIIQCPHPFGLYDRPHFGGREYRGLRTQRYTYVRDLQGPWLLYDNVEDPFQRKNRLGDPGLARVQSQLETQLRNRLQERGDSFEPGWAYLDRWGYQTDASGTVPFEW
jgi:arylsulfatase A-like enzyme